MSCAEAASVSGLIHSWSCSRGERSARAAMLWNFFQKSNQKPVKIQLDVLASTCSATRTCGCPRHCEAVLKSVPPVPAPTPGQRSPVPGNRGREEVDLKPINDVTLRFILEHSILAIGLVPNSLTVFTVKLDNVDGQKHDRQRGQQKQAAHGSSGTSSGAYEKHSWGINPYGRAVKCLAGCGHRAPFHISRSHLNFRLAPYENL
jgi:hypothetical protein